MRPKWSELDISNLSNLIRQFAFVNTIASIKTFNADGVLTYIRECATILCNVLCLLHSCPYVADFWYCLNKAIRPVGCGFLHIPLFSTVKISRKFGILRLSGSFQLSARQSAWKYTDYALCSNCISKIWLTSGYSLFLGVSSVLGVSLHIKI